jgi:hypothetical protein
MLEKYSRDVYRKLTSVTLSPDEHSAANILLNEDTTPAIYQRPRTAHLPLHRAEPQYQIRCLKTLQLLGPSQLAEGIRKRSAPAPSASHVGTTTVFSVRLRIASTEHAPQQLFKRVLTTIATLREPLTTKCPTLRHSRRLSLPEQASAG